MKDKMTYEETYQALEEIVEELEKGELSLEESFQKFTQGLEYYESCKNILTELEGKVAMLTEKNGTFTEVPFQGGEL